LDQAAWLEAVGVDDASGRQCVVDQGHDLGSDGAPVTIGLAPEPAAEIKIDPDSKRKATL
jgi:hypothetical protein